MGMLAEERHQRILRRFRDAPAVRVATLARELSVTEETIRRDLERLSRDGKLIRVHGGAVPVDSDRRDPPAALRAIVNLEEKRRIARAALRYVQEGDVIALDASSTAEQLARQLPDRPLTVVTNSLAVPAALADRTQIRTICTGGILDGPSLSFVGAVAEHVLNRFHLVKVFLSTRAVDVVRGLGVNNHEQAALKHRMIELAEQVYLLADASKFEQKAVEFFSPLSEVDLVISDAHLAPAKRRELQDAGVRVEIAE